FAIRTERNRLDPARQLPVAPQQAAPRAAACLHLVELGDAVLAAGQAFVLARPAEQAAMVRAGLRRVERGQIADERTRRRLAHFHRPVPAGRCDVFTVLRQRGAEDPVEVMVDTNELLAAGRLDDPRRIVRAAERDSLAIAGIARPI